MYPYQSKLCLPADLARRTALLPRPLVLTNGVFDLLHHGHADCLQQARMLGASLVVAVNDDESARQLGKGPGRPFRSCDERMALLAALACTDLVTCFSERNALQAVRCIRPDVYVKGGDYDVEETPEGREALALGARVRAIPFIHYTSTTALVERIRRSGAG